jgi:hypothetical protein
MAQGTIRIIQDSVGENGSGSVETPTSGADEFTILPPEHFNNGDSNNGDSNNGTSRKSARDKRKEKRASLRVTDRSNENQEVGTEPDKKTPPPKRSRTVTEVKHYLTDTEALSNAKFYLAALEMMAVSISGPNGEMTEFERAMMTPALRRTLKRIPLEAMEKGNIFLDSILLVGGMTMYMNHAVGGFRWSFPWKRAQKKGVVTDKQSPVTQPMETVVSHVQTGDIDGLAVPVPEVFTKYMNGNI